MWNFPCDSGQAKTALEAMVFRTADDTIFANNIENLLLSWRNGYIWNLMSSHLKGIFSYSLRLNFLGKKKKICTQILTLALSFPNKRTSPLNTCKVM